MIRRHVASVCLTGLFAANIFLIGAAAMRPQVLPKPRSQIVTVALEPPPPAVPAPPAPPAQKPDQTGLASWYGPQWQGRITASGKPFDDRKLTAAHRTLPLNSRVKVTNLETGNSVEVTITDRGPYKDGRVIDLSKAAAKKLGMVKQGLAPVRIEDVAG